MTRHARLGGVFLLGILLASFATGCRSTYYKAWEQFGVHKRDLLRKNVEGAKQDQEKAAEGFKSALTRLKEIYRFDGGNLEKYYNNLKSDYETASSRAGAVQERIDTIKQVATDLFTEWEAEIATITTPNLAFQSQQKLRDTRKRYEALIFALERSEASMKPVLARLNDQVIYLKHNLNAQAIGSLAKESVDVENEIQKLIRDMNASVAQAEAFIQGLK